jgi:putative oxidoreductase
MTDLLRLLFARTPARFALGATVLRVASGAILIGFGASKYAHHAREARAFDRYGLPWPDLFPYAIGAVELTFGALLVLGLATRPAALVLAGNMVGAIATGGRVDGGFVNLGLAPALLIVMLVLIWAGGGRFAADNRLALR